MEAFSALADGEASTVEEVAIRIHLGRCVSCRAAGARMTAALQSFDVVLPGLTGDAPRSDGAHEHARFWRRPSCVPEYAVVWSVGTAVCGCRAACGCGCQHGGLCQCRLSVA
ncbi:zf-HC2 domain-containing protein [Kutzneria chonburiensis]